MRTPLSNLRVDITEEGTNIVSSGGKYFSVSQQTAVLLKILRDASQGETSVELSKKLSAHLGFTVSEPEFEEAVNKLPAAFFEHTTATKEFRWSMPLIQGRSLDLLTRLLSHLFSPSLSLLLVAVSCYELWRIFSDYTIGPIDSLLVPTLVLLSIIFHELGHAAACHRGGAKPELIGVGLSGIFPVFYTNVSDIWSRGKWARIRVDIGGIYFQILYAATLTILVPWHPEALTAISLILLLAAFSCLPYFKFDGYWLLGDFLGLDDLGSSLKNKRKYLKTKYNAGLISRYDIVPLVGISIYYAGLVTLLGMTTIAVASLTVTNANNVAEGLLGGDAPLTAMLMLTILAVVIAGAVRVLMFSVREFYFLAFDLPPILRALALGILVTLAKPFLYFTRKHKAYVRAAMHGMRQTVPPIPDPKNQALSSVITKYYEVFWYRLLDSVSVSIGLWIVRRTHHIRSKRTFLDIAGIQGPVILAAPHFGSFISGALLVLSEIGRTRPIHLFYADPATDPGNAGYDNFYRRYFPEISVCLNNKRGIVKAANALKRGEILIIMPDAFYGTDLLTIELMGRSIGTMGGIAYFHQKFGATVVPILSRYNGMNNVEVHIGESFIFDISECHQGEENVRIMQQIFCWFAVWFIRHPDNWHCWDKYGRSLIERPQPWGLDTVPSSDLAQTE